MPCLVSLGYHQLVEGLLLLLLLVVVVVVVRPQLEMHPPLAVVLHLLLTVLCCQWQAGSH
jgi:uncharacterized membrane protein YqjE